MSSFDETLNAYFFIDEDTDEEPTELSSAFATLKEHIKNEKHIKWIQKQEGFALIKSGKLTKKDVFVFAKFEGELFEQLQSTKCLIVGPKCLINCLHKCEPIPLCSSPIFTTAMRGLHISASGLNAAEKDKIRILVSWMGGSYFQNLGRSITHLLSNTIKSTKYEHASLNGIPVMHVDWVHHVWQKSCSRNAVSATDPEFDKYKLPVFYEVNITCSGLDSEKKSEIMRLVEENGGTYNRAFRSQYTDIVITERNKANSDKFQAAIKYKKDVLVPEWIFESVSKGFALPTKSYKVTTMKVSTPTKSDHSVNDFTQLSDVSRISMMNASKRMDLTVNDSICSSLNETPARSLAMTKAVLTKQANAAGQQYKAILAEICPKKSKKAGTFLDGCCIYLSGFRGEEKDKLNRILNAGGATRYDEINENLTHIIVGQLDEADFRAWRSEGLLSVVNIVRLDWLLESINQKQSASENIYRVSLPTSREPDAPSPSSKKTLRSMNHSFKQPDIPTKKRLFGAPAAATPDPPSSSEKSSTMTLQNEDEDDLISQYSQDTPVNLMPPPALATTPRPADETSLRLPPPLSNSTQMSSVGGNLQTSTSTSASAARAPAPLTTDSEMSNGLTTLDYENLNFLEGMSVYIDSEHFDDEFHTQLVSECEAARGNVVNSNFRDPVDYAIVSFEKTLDVKKLPVKARHIVTELYVEECMKQNKLVDIEYFHQHIPNTANSCPLKGMTIVVSIYAGLERDFVDSVAQLLGASVNKTFVKREKPLLICPQPEGSKYQGAIKWQYPVVVSKWLLDCAEFGKKIPFQDYLVGDSAWDFPSSPALREKNSNELSRTLTPAAQTPHSPARMDTNAIENAAVTADVVPAANLNVTTEFTPLRNKRVTELAGPSRKSIGSDSPQTPTNCAGRPSCNFELMDKILAEIEDEDERECLREVILEMRNNQTPELERIKRQACTPINRKLPTPKGIPDFCTTPEFEKRMSEEIERRWRLPTKKLKPNTPIEEIRKRMLRATCKMIGIEYKGDTESPGAATTPVVKPAAVAAVNETTTPLAGTLSRKKSSFQEKMDFEDCSTNNSAQTPELKQISEYLKNCESRRQSIPKPKKPPQMFDNTEQEDGRVLRFESEKFGGGTEEMVIWKDPTEFSLSRRYKSSTMQFIGTPRFSISCSSDSMRHEIIEKAQRLRGEISENLTIYDPNCTHFLCERPNRGEKMLGSIASGKWVLGLAYIEECFAQNCFVNEELYEWGNPKAFNLPELTKEEQVIASAAHRWRKQLTESNEPDTGAFSGFHAILRISERHKESLKNVIKAGHGKILQVESPYSSSDHIRLATHCFVDIKKTPLTSSDYDVLMENRVKVLSQLYINAYLMNGKDADVGPYTIKM